MTKFIAYYRVSTSRQAVSGLGMEAQKMTVRGYVESVEGDLIAEYSDTESGSSADRLGLQKAIRHCRSGRAMLVVAKLDRLARNVHLITQLMESGVEFIAADMPEANRLTVHVIAAIAEYERQLISERTKRALKQAAANGVKLGNPNIRDQQKIASEAAKLKADRFAARMLPMIRVHDSTDGLPATALASVLNDEGVKGARGGYWSASSVIALRQRLLQLRSEVRG